MSYFSWLSSPRAAWSECVTRGLVREPVSQPRTVRTGGTEATLVSLAFEVRLTLTERYTACCCDVSVFCVQGISAVNIQVRTQVRCKRVFSSTVEISRCASKIKGTVHSKWNSCHLLNLTSNPFDWLSYVENKRRWYRMAVSVIIHFNVLEKDVL